MLIRCWGEKKEWLIFFIYSFDVKSHSNYEAASNAINANGFLWFNISLYTVKWLALSKRTNHIYCMVLCTQWKHTNTHQFLTISAEKCHNLSYCCIHIHIPISTMQSNENIHGEWIFISVYSVKWMIDRWMILLQEK